MIQFRIVYLFVKETDLRCIVTHVGICIQFKIKKFLNDVIVNDWHNRTNYRLVKVIKVCFCLKKNEKKNRNTCDTGLHLVNQRNILKTSDT